MTATTASAADRQVRRLKVTLQTLGEERKTIAGRVYRHQQRRRSLALAGTRSSEAAAELKKLRGDQRRAELALEDCDAQMEAVRAEIRKVRDQEERDRIAEARASIERKVDASAETREAYLEAVAKVESLLQEIVATTQTAAGLEDQLRKSDVQLAPLGSTRAAARLLGASIEALRSSLESIDGDARRMSGFRLSPFAGPPDPAKIDITTRERRKLDEAIEDARKAISRELRIIDSLPEDQRDAAIEQAAGYPDRVEAEAAA